MTLETEVMYLRAMVYFLLHETTFHSSTISAMANLLLSRGVLSEDELVAKVEALRPVNHERVAAALPHWMEGEQAKEWLELLRRHEGPSQ